MSTNAAVKFLPIFSDEKRVEVTLEDDQAVIKLSTWCDDLGWLGQKTLSLDAEMLDDLHRVISAARIKLGRRNAESEEPNGEIESAKVLAFPSFS
jgi:hypothetical protein